MWKQILSTMSAEKGVEALKEKAQNIISDKAASWMGLRENSSPKIKEQFESIRSSSEKERGSLFSDMMEVGGEGVQSWFHRSFPTLAKLYGTYEALSEDESEEVHPLEHDLQIFGSLSLFIPDFLLKYATDPLRKYALKPILESGLYPGAENMLKNIDSDDPDDIVNILLTINQDIVTGKVTMEKFWQHLLSKAF